jgi:aminoglycoside phosphotransferase
VLPADRAHIALPSPRAPMLICDTSPAVLDYVRRSLLAAPPGCTLPGWLFEAARRALACRQLWRLAPRIAGDETVGSGPGLARWISASGLRVVALNHSRDVDGSVVALLFEPGDRQPHLAVKLAGGYAAEARLARERVRLLRLHAAPVTAVRAELPQVLDLPVDVGPNVLATTARPGTPMYVSYRRQTARDRRMRVQADFQAAGRWLADLQAHRTGPAVGLAPGPAIAAAAEQALADRPARLREVSTALAAVQQRLGAHNARACVVHGDFWAGNILIRDGAVSGVVDWERWEPAGSPVRDLGRFVVGYSFYLDRRVRSGRPVPGLPGLVAGAPGGGVAYALRGSNWFAAVVSDFLVAGLRHHDLPPDLAPDVVLGELAAVAAEAGDSAFGRSVWEVFAATGRGCR